MNTYRIVPDGPDLILFRHSTINQCVKWIKDNKEKLKELDLEVIIEEVDEDDNVIRWWQQYDFDIDWKEVV